MKKGIPSIQGKQPTAEEMKVLRETLCETSFLLEEKVEELSLLRRVVDIAGHIFNIKLFYHHLMDIILEETNAQNCSLMLMKDKLILEIARGRNDNGIFFDYPIYAKTSFSLGEGIAGKAALTREIIVINDAQKEQQFKVKDSGVPIRSLLCAPLFAKERLFGVINISHSQPSVFSNDKQKVMKILCGIVSSIVDNAMEHLHNEENFKAMFEGVRFSIMLFDSETLKIVDCNRYTEDWLGYQKEELTALPSSLNIIVHDKREAAKKIFKEIIDKNSADFYELSFIKKDGSTTTGEIKGLVISYRGKKVIHLTINDVTEKREMEKKLLQSEKLKFLGEMAAGVAHDFNNVLAAILGRAQLLKDNIAKSLKEHERKKSLLNIIGGLEIIEKAALDGAETVRRIREFSRKKDNDHHFTAVNINTIIEDALEFTKVKWKDDAESKGVRININKKFSSHTPTAGNASELREVFINLLNNAIDAMPEGGTISIKSTVKDSSIVVTFSDTGTGISQPIAERVFDPFFTTKGVQSTGLGLSIVYGIVSRHKGSITMESNEGKGTTFILTFPMLKTVSQKKKGSYSSQKDFRAKILIIEDEKAVRDLLCDILKSGGYELKSAKNGDQGIKLFKKEAFDLVFTDLGMPGISGWQVAKAIKTINRNTPVALITGWEVSLDEGALRNTGVDLIINKPFKINQIFQLVQDGLRIKDRTI